MKLPTLNETYNYFDDGKLHMSRLETVTITDIIPFNNIDSTTKYKWMNEVKTCNWLYDKETDYFIKGMLKESHAEVIFVRCKNNGWFSIGWFGGRLDVDGSMTNQLIKKLNT